MQIVDLIIKIGAFLGAITTIIVALSKLLDVKLKPLTNQNRMQFRHEIVSFATEIQRGTTKRRDEFTSIYEMINEYESICEKYNIKNHLFEESVHIIDNAYKNLK